MKYRQSFEKWISHFRHEPEILATLKTISESEDELVSRFGTDLEFGTAGLRGIMGLGTNRLNKYTIRKATQGLADYLNSINSSPSAVISFDSRINSDMFARETASVLTANGIKTYITKKLAPTPFLSFLVRELKCTSGIMITASHNPSEYNGYKCYGSDGAQMSSEYTQKVYEHIDKLEIFEDIKYSDFQTEVQEGSIEFVSEEIYEKYINTILSQAINKDYPEKCELNVTYTPLNGAGKDFVKEILQKSGVNQLNIVKEQENPDGNFPTCKYPNPETKEAFKLAIETAKENSSDIIIATDPDSDRLGVGVFHKGEYVILNGNQIGILLFSYILSQKREKGLLPENPLAVRTLVSSKMIDSIAKDYGCEVRCVPTGFKNIGKKIYELEINKALKSFVFGFEESNGYLSGTYARDKDAVEASLLICEMCSFYKKMKLTLVDVLNDLYKKYGFYSEKTVSIEFKGTTGKQKMQSIISNLKVAIFDSIGTKKIIAINDYLKSQSFNRVTNQILNLEFPKLDILEFVLSDNSSIIVRPSGTEPKLKLYFMTMGKNEHEASLNRDMIESDFCSKIKSLS